MITDHFIPSEQTLQAKPHLKRYLEEFEEVQKNSLRLIPKKKEKKSRCMVLVVWLPRWSLWSSLSLFLSRLEEEETDGSNSCMTAARRACTLDVLTTTQRFVKTIRIWLQTKHLTLSSWKERLRHSTALLIEYLNPRRVNCWPTAFSKWKASVDGC